MSCKHCSGAYLERMLHATEPEALVRLAQRLADSGGEGLLLTGGSDAAGKVPLCRFAGALRTIRETTSLRINAHVGLMPKPELEELVSAGVESFSVDVYGSEGAIRKTLGLEAGPDDYLAVIANLRALGARNVAPHICVGIEGGEVKGEFRAVEMVAPYEPDALVILALVPTRGTAYRGAKPPSADEIIGVIEAANASLPRTRILLGCMRPRHERGWEALAAKAGLAGIAVPSRQTTRTLASDGWDIAEKSRCCALE